MSFLTGQSCCVLKSWYTGGDPEQGFRRCFADGLNQMLVSPVAQAIFTSPPPNATDKPVIRTYTQSQCQDSKSVPALPSDVPAQQPSEPQSHHLRLFPGSERLHTNKGVTLPGHDV